MPLNNHNWGYAMVRVDSDGSFAVRNRRILPGHKPA
jgi:hypothetical protein